MTRQTQGDAKGKADGPHAKSREPLTDGGPKTSNSRAVQERLDRALCNVARETGERSLGSSITRLLDMGANPNATEEDRTPVMELADRYVTVVLENLDPGPGGPTTSDNETTMAHLRGAIKILVDGGASGETAGQAVEALRSEMGLD